jgi:hypothetical protein
LASHTLLSDASDADIDNKNDEGARSEGASLRDEDVDDGEAPRKRPLIQRLDNRRRAKVLSALVALIILGFALVLLAWLGARATRRYMRREPLLFGKPADGTPLREKDWSEKPLDE